MRKSFLNFSPPNFGQEEIDEVVDTLRSDWITTTFFWRGSGWTGHTDFTVNIEVAGVPAASLAVPPPAEAGFRRSTNRFLKNLRAFNRVMRDIHQVRPTLSKMLKILI